jgi:hypothetical protein
MNYSGLIVLPNTTGYSPGLLLIFGIGSFVVRPVGCTGHQFEIQRTNFHPGPQRQR